MIDDEFVYAVIADHISGDDRWDKILQKENGRTILETAVQAALESRSETGVDLVIVLSSNEAVLDAASDLGAVANQVPSFFNVEVMLKTYFADPGVDIDPNDNPFVIVYDPYTLEREAPRALSDILGN
jgi:hypothetical protein